MSLDASDDSFLAFKTGKDVLVVRQYHLSREGINLNVSLMFPEAVDEFVDLLFPYPDDLKSGFLDPVEGLLEMGSQERQFYFSGIKKTDY